MPEGKAVQRMFAGISGRYDAANHLLSGGVDYYWRHQLVRAVRKHAPGHVTDLATGSGDVALALRKKLPPECPVEAYDFCEPMLDEARRKATRKEQRGHLRFSFGDCLELPIASESTDAITIAFGLRNLEDRSRGLAEMLRLLRPGKGAVFILEFTQPAAWLKPFYGIYLRFLLPVFAKLATGNRDAYDYLAGSISSFPEKAAITSELEAAGFERVSVRGLTGSIVALHIGHRPG